MSIVRHYPVALMEVDYVLTQGIKKVGYILTASSLNLRFTEESRQTMRARAENFVIFVERCKVGPKKYEIRLLPTKPAKL